MYLYEYNIWVQFLTNQSGVLIIWKVINKQIKCVPFKKEKEKESYPSYGRFCCFFWCFDDLTDAHLMKLNAQTTPVLLFLTLIVLDYLCFGNEIQWKDWIKTSLECWNTYIFLQATLWEQKPVYIRMMNYPC